MHYEYAVEPAAIGANWETFRYLIEKFGFDKGRLISRLPIKWERKVIQAAKEAKISDIKLKSMVERLKNTSKQRSAHFGRSYISSDTWLENATREHHARPFRAIIFAGEIRPCNEVLCPDECDEDNNLFSAPISQNIMRSADSMADALLPLAATAKEIDMVDPYFDLRQDKGDYVSPLATLLSKLSVLKFPGKIIRIHYRTHESRPPADILLSKVPQLTRGIIPVGYTIQLYEWAEIEGGEDFHDRFFLTNTGGVMIGAGLSAVTTPETAIFTLLDVDHANSIRDRFAPNSTVYKNIGPAVQIESNGNAIYI